MNGLIFVAIKLLLFLFFKLVYFLYFLIDYLSISLSILWHLSVIFYMQFSIVLRVKETLSRFRSADLPYRLPREQSVIAKPTYRHKHYKQIQIHLLTHTHTPVYLNTLACVCVCVCVGFGLLTLKRSTRCTDTGQSGFNQLGPTASVSHTHTHVSNYICRCATVYWCLFASLWGPKRSSSSSSGSNRHAPKTQSFHKSVQIFIVHSGCACTVGVPKWEMKKRSSCCTHARLYCTSSLPLSAQPALALAPTPLSAYAYSASRMP